MSCLNQPGSKRVIRYAPFAGISIEARGASCASARLTFYAHTLDGELVTLRCLDVTPAIPNVRAVLSEGFEVTPHGLAFLEGGRAELTLPYDAVHVVNADKVLVYALETAPDGWVPLPRSACTFDEKDVRLLFARIDGIPALGQFAIAEAL